MKNEAGTPIAGELSEHAVQGRKLHVFDVDRRDFLRMFGGGIAIGLAAPVPAQESGRARGGPSLPQDIGAWLHIAEDGRITVFTGKVEIGQNIRTSLAQQVAEELSVPVGSVELVMGDTERVPFDLGTFGSRTTPTMAPQLKAAAAAARELLVEMAADRLKAEKTNLSVEGGRVVERGSGRSLGYGELTRGAKLVRLVGADAAVKPATGWKVAGTAAPKADGRDFVTGKHRYPCDVVRPGLLHGKVLRAPAFKAPLLSVETREAEKIVGVKVVRDGDFVGVAAPDGPTAERALATLEARWGPAPPQPTHKEIFDHLKKSAETNERDFHHAAGSVEQALASADVKLARTYTVAYIAHAPLEPRAAVAEWAGDRLTVWTGTQRPFAVRDELAEAFRVAPERVRVQVPDTGAAYGGKHTGDAALEAARLSKAAGKPVKVVWTREEEFTWAYFRPAGVIEIRSGAQRDGTVTAWEYHNTNSGPAAIGTPYAIANQLVRFHSSASPLRQGSYRGLAATANNFARESHMDELAAALGIDPLRLRLQNLQEPRLKAVLQAAADRFGWGKAPAAGRGQGIAGGVEKGGYVATCVEAEVDRATRRVRLVRAVVAFECGAVVNPNGLKNQVEGAVIQGLGGALFEAVRFENGKIANPHFSQYRVPRFPDVPPIEVVILDRKDLPSAGAGETPIMGLAPAIGGAIFAASGVRLYGLPLVPDGAVAAGEKSAAK